MSAPRGSHSPTALPRIAKISMTEQPREKGGEVASRSARNAERRSDRTSPGDAEMAREGRALGARDPGMDASNGMTMA
jgi:hypothetical protein